MSAAPTLRIERRLLREGATAIACVDEAGRGALCGPVSVGMVVVTSSTPSAPTGVRDSKLLTAERRNDLAPRIRRWAAAHAVGLASSEEIDRIGIMAALRLAGQRALAALPVRPDCVLLDGNHDYLSHPRQPSLFADDLLVDGAAPIDVVPPVVTMVKADMRCSGVAAASILAKTTRDSMMLELSASYPDYGWHENKGYAAPEHLTAIRRLGPTPHHRVSWSLPSQSAEQDDAPNALLPG